MEIEYVNNYNRNYVRIPFKGDISNKLRYQYQILTSRNLDGIIKAEIHTTDEQSYLYYDITSLQNIGTLVTCKKITRAWMDQFVQYIKTALWSLEQYLMDERNIMVEQYNIFQDIETGKFVFIYYPYYIEHESSNIQELLDFLLENIDINDPETMEKVCDLCSRLDNMGSRFTLRTFLQIWEAQNKNQDNKEVVAEGDLFDKENELSMTMEACEPEAEPHSNMAKWNLTNLLWGKPNTKNYECISLPKENEHQTEFLEVAKEREERKLFGNGKQNRQVICLEKLPITIGKKADSSDVIIKDQSISRLHARLSEEDGQIFLEDLNATNGTYKNGVRLKPYEKVEILREDEIRLGTLSFTYR